ncbi:MAG: YncE family protein [Bacillota bacterium]
MKRWISGLVLIIILAGCTDKELYVFPDDGGELVFVAHLKEPLLTVIDAESEDIVGELELPFIASDVALVDGRLILSSVEEEQLYAFDFDTQALDAIGQAGTGISKLLEVDGALYAAHATEDRVSKISVEPFEVEATAATDAHPQSLTAGDGKIYAANVYGHSVQAMDEETLQIIESYDIIDRPNGLAFADGHLLVGGHGPSGALNRELVNYSLGQKEITERIDVGLMPIEVIADEDKFYVLNHGSHEVVVLAEDLSEQGRLSVADNPYYGAVQDNRLYVSSLDGDTVTVIDTDSFEKLSEITVSSGPHAMAIREAR